MTETDRRAFLRKLAATAAYSAPVVYSMAAPMDIVAQQSGKGSVKGHQGHGGDKGKGGGATFVVPPPGGDPPGSSGR